MGLLVQKLPAATLIPTTFTGVTSGSVSFVTPPVVGNTIVAAFTAQTGSPQPLGGVSDSYGNGPGGAYTQAKTIVSAGNSSAFLHYALVSNSGSGFKLTVTWTSSTNFAIGVMEWTGMNQSWPAPAQTATATATSNAPAVGPLTPANPSTFVGVVIGDAVDLTSLLSQQVEVYNQPSSGTASIGVQYLAANDARSLTWTLSVSPLWLAIMAQFEDIVSPAVSTDKPKKLSPAVWQG
jgi:hypothetical protein